jgi:hypothetical protein
MYCHVKKKKKSLHVLTYQLGPQFVEAGDTKTVEDSPRSPNGFPHNNRMDPSVNDMQ